MNDQVQNLDERSRAIFRQIVETYLSTGDPVGSRNLSRQLPMTLSPASVRNIMSDLEDLNLIYSPHTSAGRVPTESGLRLFVDALLEIGDISPDERLTMENQIQQSANTKNMDDMLIEAGEMISGLSHCAGVVLTEKQTLQLKQIEFLQLEVGKGLAVLVGKDGSIENRIFDLPKTIPPSALTEASNYLNSIISGLTVAQARAKIDQDLKKRKAELDGRTQKVIEAGLATWSGGADDRKSLIVRGRSNLLKDVSAQSELELIGELFDDMEAKRELMQLLGLADDADGVRIFIGSESKLFSLSGSSLIVSPFQGSEKKVVGMLGVIGPTRLDYGRIIPMVDYTAKLVGRILS